MKESGTLSASGYTHAFQRHNLNLETTSGKAGTEVTVVQNRRSPHDNVIGHYLNIKHYQ
ncbi:IS1 family transposase [Shigella flexneri]